MIMMINNDDDDEEKWSGRSASFPVGKITPEQIWITPALQGGGGVSAFFSSNDPTHPPAQPIGIYWEHIFFFFFSIARLINVLDI